MCNKKNDELLEALDIEWNTCKKYLTEKDYEGAANYIRDLTSKEMDVNFYKTILILTKSFKDHEIVGPARAELYRKFYNFMIEKYPNFNLYYPHPDDNA
jgi:hypothetical protein